MTWLRYTIGLLVPPGIRFTIAHIEVLQAS